MTGTSEDTQPSGSPSGGVVGFLLARIAEDEAVARVASQTIGDGEWLSGGDLVKSVSLTAVATTPVGHHVARYDPARVLAECQAKRAIVEAASDYVSEFENDEWRTEDTMTAGRVAGRARSWRADTLRTLAAVYADHPDYDESWRP